MALSPDGLTIASVDDNGQLRLWERQSGQPIGSPLADTSEIRRVAFSADGTQVVALEKEGMLRSWPAPVSWQARLCEKLTRDMSPDQWRTWLTPEIAFMQQCDRSAEGATERR